MQAMAFLAGQLQQLLLQQCQVAHTPPSLWKLPAGAGFYLAFSQIFLSLDGCTGEKVTANDYQCAVTRTIRSVRQVPVPYRLW